MKFLALSLLLSVSSSNAVELLWHKPDLIKTRADIVKQARENAIEFLRADLEFVPPEVHLIAKKSLAKLTLKKRGEDKFVLRFNYRKKGDKDLPECLERQMKLDSSTAQREMEYEHDGLFNPQEYDELQEALGSGPKALSFVDDKSNNIIHLCNAYFHFKVPSGDPQQTEAFLGQVIIHELTHLVLKHTTDNRKVDILEKEASYFTYEQMIKGHAAFYEDHYYTFFGFNSHNFNYQGKALRDRYRNFVLR